MDFSDKDTLLTLLLFIALCLTLWVRIEVEATHYTSPDSDYYLRTATNVLSGKGLTGPVSYPFNEHTPEYYFAIWPAGYPLFIAGISWLTGVSPLVATKIINFLALGAIFLLAFRWVGPKAWFPLLAFCSFDMLEVFSYSWSEPPFLFFVLLFCFLMHQSLRQEDKFFPLKLTVCLLFLFIFRYAGLIYFFFAGLFALYFFWKREKKKCWQFVFALAISSLFVCLYWYNNYLQTGFISGIERIFPDAEEVPHFLKLFLHGLWNAFSIARNYYFVEDYLYLLLFALQACLTLYLLAQRNTCFLGFFSSDDARF